MTLSWRDNLNTLLPQFESKAANSPNIFHLMIETSDSERDKLSGPSWFDGFSNNGPRTVNGEPLYRKWDCSSLSGLPSREPFFREPKPDESFSEEDRVVRDKNGVVRAVFVPMKIRMSYFCGCPSQEVSDFESLATIAAQILVDADDLSDHFFASDLCDIFKPPSGGVRQVFGDVPQVPNQFMAQGWASGVLQFENGVLIDTPLAQSTPDSKTWMLLLHRLGWRKTKGSPLSANRMCWDDTTEVAYDMVDGDWSSFSTQFAERFTNVSKESFYSALGTKDAPININLASVFAIKLLVADLHDSKQISSDKQVPIDYTNEHWNRATCPPIKSCAINELNQKQHPEIGILVATETEKQSVLCQLKPPHSLRSVLQVFEGNNTYYAGRLGSINVVLVKAMMGSIGRDSSSLVTDEFIKTWKLNGVVMVGIAFGKDTTKQMIGGVLISDRVISYEPQRIGEELNQNRGEEHQSTPILLNRFRNILGWEFCNPEGKNCSYQVGPLLSGEKLVDNSNFKSNLFERYPTAIGGEMEGAGFAAAAQRNNCEWIVLKAICDWGDGTKQKQHQAFAAAAAVDLLSHTINQVGALDALNK